MEDLDLTYLKQIIVPIVTVLVFSGIANAQENQACITHQNLVQQINEKFQAQKDKTPEFRISKAQDGQSLLYWHLGGETGSFFAATFKKDGCAILTTNGELRRFTFPKTAFNTGVFFEMEKLDIKF